jgi:hypothetical protein
MSENEKATVQAASASRMDMRREAQNQLLFLSAQRGPARCAACDPVGHTRGEGLGGSSRLGLRSVFTWRGVLCLNVGRVDQVPFLVPGLCQHVFHNSVARG